MSNYSNPNEVCKVKHILSLAQSINDKIDGVTITPTIKVAPTLTIGSWAKADTIYSAAITYNGDGTLSTSTGTISGSTLTVNDDDGAFSGTLTATAGSSYAATTLIFSHDTEDVPTGGTPASATKTEPTLTVGTTENIGFSYQYNGDGDVYVYCNGYVMSINRTNKRCSIVPDTNPWTSPPEYSGTLYAAEGTSYAAKSVSFNYVSAATSPAD